MKDQPAPDATARVQMRTDGPPAPFYADDDPPHQRVESFLAMTWHRLPWLVIALAGSVLMGALIGQAIAANV